MAAARPRQIVAVPGGVAMGMELNLIENVQDGLYPANL